MRVISVTLKGFDGPCIYSKENEIESAMAEIKALLLEDDDVQEIIIEQFEMDEEKFKKLSEFAGY